VVSGVSVRLAISGSVFERTFWREKIGSPEALEEEEGAEGPELVVRPGPLVVEGHLPTETMESV